MIVKRQGGEKCEKILYKNANKREEDEIGLLKIHICFKNRSISKSVITY